MDRNKARQLEFQLIEQREKIERERGEKFERYFSMEMEQTMGLIRNPEDGDGELEFKVAISMDLDRMLAKIQSNRPIDASEREEYQTLLEIYGEYQRMLASWLE